MAVTNPETEPMPEKDYSICVLKAAEGGVWELVITKYLEAEAALELLRQLNH